MPLEVRRVFVGLLWGYGKSPSVSEEVWEVGGVVGVGRKKSVGLGSRSAT